MVQNEEPRRGRPRSFDLGVAVDAAQGAFWRSGYSETSLDTLTAAMGVNRPSLYAAFGDKRALFLRAMDAYLARIREVGPPFLARPEPLEAALLRFGHAVLDIYVGADGGRGCFLISTAITPSPDDPEIRLLLAEGLRLLDALVLSRLERDRTRGVVRAGADLPALARHFGGVLNALALRARAGEPRGELEAALAFAASLTAGHAVIRGGRG